MKAVLCPAPALCPRRVPLNMLFKVNNKGHSPCDVASAVLASDPDDTSSKSILSFLETFLVDNDMRCRLAVPSELDAPLPCPREFEAVRRMQRILRQTLIARAHHMRARALQLGRERVATAEQARYEREQGVVTRAGDAAADEAMRELSTPDGRELLREHQTTVLNRLRHERGRAGLQSELKTHAMHLAKAELVVRQEFEAQQATRAAFRKEHPEILLQWVFPDIEWGALQVRPSGPGRAGSWLRGDVGVTLARRVWLVYVLHHTLCGLYVFYTTRCVACMCPTPHAVWLAAALMCCGSHLRDRFGRVTKNSSAACFSAGWSTSGRWQATSAAQPWRAGRSNRRRKRRKNRGEGETAPVKCD